jgi:hypothetical protein
MFDNLCDGPMACMRARGCDSISATVPKKSIGAQREGGNCLNLVTIEYCIGCGSDQVQRNTLYDACGATRGED